MRAVVSRSTGFVLVAYAFLVTMVGTTLPTPLYPLFEQRYSFGELMVTVIFAVYAFGVIAGLLVFGNLSDEIGRKPVLLTGLAFSAISAFLFVFAGSLAPIFGGRVVSGLSAGVFTGTATAMLVDLAPGGRRRLASFVAVVVNLGGLGLGTLLSGLLADYARSPLRLPFIVDLVLLVPAVLGLLVTPETVQRQAFRLRLQRLSVPPEVRNVFILFSASIVGQLLVSRLSDRRALILGCELLAGGVGLLALALWIESLAALIASASVVGLGQGLVIGAGLAAINQRAPVERRGEIASSFFVVMYVGLSLPVIGVGLAANAWSLRGAGIAFSVAVAVLVLTVLVSLSRSDE